MLTSAQISAAPAYLTDVAIAQWLSLFRAYPRYVQVPGLYPDLPGHLSSLKQGVIVAADLVKAQVLNAAMTEIEALGPGDVSLTKDVTWSLVANREEFVVDALNGIYEVPVQQPTSVVVPMQSDILICSIHHRSFSYCGCRGTALFF